MSQTIDYDSGNLIGAGENTTYHYLKQLTFLQPRSLKEFPRNGIYRQVPLKWIISKTEFKELSEAHQKGSIDIFLVLNQARVAIRVQGKGHGDGLKGIGKVQHDKVQKNLLEQYCSLVDIHIRECPNIFKERIGLQSKLEVINSFKTAQVMIPVTGVVQ